jgi:hypothetical protein
MASYEVKQRVNGEIRTVTREFVQTGFAIKIDGQLYKPVLTSEVEIENDTENQRTTDQCGNTERNNVADMGWTLAVNGIVTSNGAREKNLTLAMLRDIVAPSDTITIRSDIAGGGLTEFEVANTVITNSSDLHTIETGITDGQEKAYEFQLQLGETESS